MKFLEISDLPEPKFAPPVALPTEDGEIPLSPIAKNHVVKLCDRDDFSQKIPLSAFSALLEKTGGSCFSFEARFFFALQVWSTRGYVGTNKSC